MKNIKVNNGVHIRTPETDKYLNQIKKFPLLVPEEEPIYFEKIKNGDQQAYEQVLQANLRFVVACAKQYVGCGISIGDLIAEGNTGLIKAIELFDHTKGFKFISYAIGWIRCAILASISNHSRMVRLPTSHTTKITKIKNNADKIEQDDEFLNFDKVAEALNLNSDLVELILNETTHTSMDKQIDDDCDMTYGDLFGTEPEINQILDDEITKNVLSTILNELTVIEQDVLKRFYGISPYFGESTVESIAEDYKCGKVKIRRIIKKAFTKLKKYKGYYEKCI